MILVLFGLIKKLLWVSSFLCLISKEKDQQLADKTLQSIKVVSHVALRSEGSLSWTLSEGVGLQKATFWGGTAAGATSVLEV